MTAAGMGRGRVHQSFAMPWGPLPAIDPADMFKRPYPNFRRMDEYSRLGLTAVALALTDAGLAEWTRKRDIGIIASSFYGCLGTDIEYYKTVPKPVRPCFHTRWRTASWERQRSALGLPESIM